MITKTYFLVNADMSLMMLETYSESGSGKSIKRLRGEHIFLDFPSGKVQELDLGTKDYSEFSEYTKFEDWLKSDGWRFESESVYTALRYMIINMFQIHFGLHMHD